MLPQTEGPKAVDYFVTDDGMFRVDKTATKEQLLEVITWMKPRLYKLYRKRMGLP